jgi:methylenetetrahydrofolate--tRNA-(uracil-5-)-methyltransferase
MITFPEDTMCGALLHYITSANELKPMYANFGLLTGGKDREKIAMRSIETMRKFSEEVEME